MIYCKCGKSETKGQSKWKYQINQGMYLKRNDHDIILNKTNFFN